MNPENFEDVNMSQDQGDSEQSQAQEPQLQQQQQQQQPLEPEQFRKVFIGGLSFKTDDETFKTYFSKFGELVDYVVMKDKESGKSRGFGFVTYSNSAMVDELMKNRPHIIDGRQIEPKRATPREDSGKQEVQATVKKLFVGGIRDTINEEDLKTYFGAYGNITDAVIMRDKEKNTTRGFGFVTFDDYDPVDKIIIEKHHTVNGINLQCQKALPKDGQNNSKQQNRQMNNSFNNGFQRNNNNNNFMGNQNNGFQMGGFNSNGMNFNNGGMNFNNQMNGGGNKMGRNGGGGNGGPMRGPGKFQNRSQGPYGGGGGGGGAPRGGLNRGGKGRGGGGSGNFNRGNKMNNNNKMNPNMNQGNNMNPMGQMNPMVANM